MAALALAGAAEGSWLRAERQSAGRGRHGRTWVSESGNLYASTLVRLRPTDPPAATLGLVAAVALHESVATHCSDGGLTIKWPNDLLLGHAKLSGILLERSHDAVVMGFGVNVAHHPDLPERPTSCLLDAGCHVESAVLLDTLVEALARWLSRWRSEGLAPVRQRWLAAAHPLDTALAVRLPDGTAFEGLFAGLDSEGALLLRLADGAMRVIHAADVFLI